MSERARHRLLQFKHHVKQLETPYILCSQSAGGQALQAGDVRGAPRSVRCVCCVRTGLACGSTDLMCGLWHVTTSPDLSHHRG